MGAWWRRATGLQLTVGCAVAQRFGRAVEVVTIWRPPEFSVPACCGLFRTGLLCSGLLCSGLLYFGLLYFGLTLCAKRGTRIKQRFYFGTHYQF
ncbi:MAG: hypothetical protein ACJARR_000200 [Pseudophaeobacter arcticus]